MVPLRLVSETFGYKTSWTTDGTIHIGSGDGAVDVTLKVGADNYLRTVFQVLLKPVRY